MENEITPAQLQSLAMAMGEEAKICNGPGGEYLGVYLIDSNKRPIIKFDPLHNKEQETELSYWLQDHKRVRALSMYKDAYHFYCVEIHTDKVIVGKGKTPAHALLTATIKFLNGAT